MKKGRKDFIFDLETIGANVFVCPVVDVAYTIFEWDVAYNQYCIVSFGTNLELKGL